MPMEARCLVSSFECLVAICKPLYVALFVMHICHPSAYIHFVVSERKREGRGREREREEREGGREESRRPKMR